MCYIRCWVPVHSAHDSSHIIDSPDYTAGHADDVVNLLVSAIRTAGLNRVRIYEAYEVVRAFTIQRNGTIEWDTVGQNQRQTGLQAQGPTRDERYGHRSPAVEAAIVHDNADLAGLTAHSDSTLNMDPVTLRVVELLVR
jgi:hypothetical protein